MCLVISQRTDSSGPSTLCHPLPGQQLRKDRTGWDLEPVTGVDQMAVKGNQTVSEKELEEYEGAHHRGVRTWVITMPEIGHLCSAVG